jgi:hypothetical protein
VLEWQLNAINAAFLPSDERDELSEFVLEAYTR